MRLLKLLLIAALLGLSFGSYTLHASDVVRLGAVFSASGVAQPHNQPMWEGTRWVVAYINETGGILGKPIELLEFDRSAYSMGLADSFRESFESLGGKVLMELEYQHNQTDFSEILSDTKKAAPQVIYLPGRDESAWILLQAQKMGISAVPLGGDSWDTEIFYKKGGKKLKNAYFTDHWNNSIDSPVSKNFVKLREQVQAPTTARTALTYDAVMLLKEAIERAGTPEPAKIREALARTKDFSGVTGKITFSEQGDPIKSAVIMKITDGKKEYIKMVDP
jgi:branched-chain amino acid transport system substrate-binding protein